jgi:hypothetical protein
MADLKMKVDDNQSVENDNQSVENDKNNERVLFVDNDNNKTYEILKPAENRNDKPLILVENKQVKPVENKNNKQVNPAENNKNIEQQKPIEKKDDDPKSSTEEKEKKDAEKEKKPEDSKDHENKERKVLTTQIKEALPDQCQNAKANEINQTRISNSCVHFPSGIQIKPLRRYTGVTDFYYMTLQQPVCAKLDHKISVRIQGVNFNVFPESENNKNDVASFNFPSEIRYCINNVNMDPIGLTHNTECADDYCIKTGTECVISKGTTIVLTDQNNDDKKNHVKMTIAEDTMCVM